MQAVDAEIEFANAAALGERLVSIAGGVAAMNAVDEGATGDWELRIGRNTFTITIRVNPVDEANLR